MKSVLKAFLIGITLVIIGAIIIIATLAVNGWKFKAEYEMRTFTAQSANTRVVLEYGAGTLRTEFYDGDVIEITYPESKSFKTSVTESDGKLIFSSSPKWYTSFFHWGSYWDIPETVVKLPSGTVFDMEINLSAGEMTLAGGTYGNVNLNVSAGKLEAGGISCKNLYLHVSAGTLKLDGADCGLLDCDVSAGKLALTSIVCPVIDCDVSAGNISMAVNGVKSDYTIKTDVSAGSCNLSDQTGSTDKRLNLNCSAGTVSVTFSD